MSDTIALEPITSEQLLENFLNTFQLLSAKQKKIWQILQWYSVNYRVVFPSHASIAKQVGCHRDTVIQAIKKFEKNGWLYYKNRCYRSCVYFILDILKKIDTKLNETFRVKSTESPTVNPTLYNTYSSSCNVRYEKPAEKRTVTVQSIKDQRTIPSEKTEIIMKMGISDKKDVWCLSRYPFHILVKAYEDLSTRYSKQPIFKVAAWITDRCKSNLKKYGG